LLFLFPTKVIATGWVVSAYVCPSCVLVHAGLCRPGHTRVLVSFELRSEAVKATFLEEAHRVFPHVSCRRQHINIKERLALLCMSIATFVVLGGSVVAWMFRCRAWVTGQTL
jgi:hypothetical protein